jgi:hypothetical protein
LKSEGWRCKWQKQNVSAVVQTETATAPLLLGNTACAASTAILLEIETSVERGTEEVGGVDVLCEGKWTYLNSECRCSQSQLMHLPVVYASLHDAICFKRANSQPQLHGLPLESGVKHPLLLTILLEICSIAIFFQTRETALRQATLR